MAENIHLLKEDLSISMGKANLLGVVIALPIAFLLDLLLIAACGFEETIQGLKQIFRSPIPVLAIAVVGTVLHELLHGLTWIIAGRQPFSAVKFGVYWKVLTPYAHLKKPVDITSYRLALAIPGLVLGVLPTAAGFAVCHLPIILFGMLFTLAAVGDGLVLWVTRRVETGRQVEDHPSRVGCYVLGEQGGRPQG